MMNPWESIATPPRDVRASRIDANHPLDLYWAKDHMSRYLLVYEYPSSSKVIIKSPPELEGIETIANRSRGDISRLILILNERDNWELFYSLCTDLLRATQKSKTPETASGIILTRLRRWQNFLRSKRANILSEEKIKGLIGELLFLRDKLTPKYGISNAVNFWQGPEGSPQDFNINDSSVEVKCQMGGSIPSVKIQSADQLYTQLANLYLFVVTMGKSDDGNERALNLNSLTEQIRVSLGNESATASTRFEDLLLEAGYIYNKKYDEYNYIVTGYNVFHVIDDFPRITPDEIKQGVMRVSYQIRLADCSPYEISIDKWEI